MHPCCFWAQLDFAILGLYGACFAATPVANNILMYCGGYIVPWLLCYALAQLDFAILGPDLLLPPAMYVICIYCSLGRVYWYIQSVYIQQPSQGIILAAAALILATGLQYSPFYSSCQVQAVYSQYFG